MKINNPSPARGRGKGNKMEWNYLLLQSLMDESGLTGQDVANAVDVSLPLVCAWLHGRAVPTRKSFVALADLFGVSLDYIMGRMSDEEARQVQMDYKGYFTQRLDAAWNTYLAERRRGKTPKVPAGVVPPWPLNLLEACNVDIADVPREIALEAALKRLPKRSEQMLLAYYKDGRTLEETGVSTGLSTERARQVITKAVQQLRSPELKDILLTGYDPREDYLVKRKQRQDEWEKRLDTVEASLREREEGLMEMQAEIVRMEQTITMNAQKCGMEIRFTKPPLEAEDMTESVMDLALSDRARNALLRANIATVGDIVRMRASGLLRVRYMGQLTVSEIRDAVLKKTGFDIYD